MSQCICGTRRAGNGRARWPHLRRDSPARPAPHRRVMRPGQCHVLSGMVGYPVVWPTPYWPSLIVGALHDCPVRLCMPRRYAVLRIQRACIFARCAEAPLPRDEAQQWHGWSERHRLLPCIASHRIASHRIASHRIARTAARARKRARGGGGRRLAQRQSDGADRCLSSPTKPSCRPSAR